MNALRLSQGPYQDVYLVLMQIPLTQLVNIITCVCLSHATIGQQYKISDNNQLMRPQS